MIVAMTGCEAIFWQSKSHESGVTGDIKNEFPLGFPFIIWEGRDNQHWKRKKNWRLLIAL